MAPHRTITLYLTLSVMFRFSITFAAAMYVTYLHGYGLGQLEAHLVNASYFLVQFLFEVPTGVVADVFGRKRSLVLGFLLYSAGDLVYASGNSMIDFMIAESICAVGSTMLSGAFDAWLVDSLAHAGHEGALHKIFARRSMLSLSGGIVGSILGCYAYAIADWLPWLIGGLIGITCALIAHWHLREDYFTPPEHVTWRNWAPSMRATTALSIAHARTSENVRAVIVMNAMMFVCTQAPNMGWQPMFGAFVSTEYFGWIFAGLSLFIILGARLASHTPRFVNGDRGMMVISLSVVGASLSALLLSDGMSMVVIVMFVQEIGRGMYVPRMQSLANKDVPGPERATILSFITMVEHLGAFIGLVVSGLIAHTHSITFACGLSGVLLLATVVYVKLREPKPMAEPALEPSR